MRLGDLLSDGRQFRLRLRPFDSWLQTPGHDQPMRAAVILDFVLRQRAEHLGRFFNKAKDPPANTSAKPGVTCQP
jgi:hypothetical protein